MDLNVVISHELIELLLNLLNRTSASLWWHFMSVYFFLWRHVCYVIALCLRQIYLWIIKKRIWNLEYLWSCLLNTLTCLPDMQQDCVRTSGKLQLQGFKTVQGKEMNEPAYQRMPSCLHNILMSLSLVFNRTVVWGLQLKMQIATSRVQCVCVCV